MPEQREGGAPPLGAVGPEMLRLALLRGWQDFRATPWLGITFAGVYVLLGWVMLAITLSTGQSYWLIFAAVGFPLVGPFAAVGLYETSRRLQKGCALDPARIFGVVLAEGQRQIPSISAIIIFMFLFWFFIAHMIFALFLGLSTMTNVSSSYDVFLTPNGLMMLGVGTVVGALFSLLLYMITVISLPMLLDRDVDFVTAMISSFSVVTANPLPMLGWGVFIAAITLIALVPLFLGLFLVLPLLGHASWHLYDQICAAGAATGTEGRISSQDVPNTAAK